MGDLSSLGALGVIIVLLAGVTHEVSEQLFGGFLHKKFMYWASLLTGVVVTYGAHVLAPQFPPFAPLMDLSLQVILAGGVVVGWTATKLHKPLMALDGGTDDASLSGIAKSLVSRNNKTEVSVEIDKVLDYSIPLTKMDAAFAEVVKIERSYKVGELTLAQAQALVEVWRKEHPDINVLPPGYPGV